MVNFSISQLQHKIEMIEKLCEKVDVIKAESLKWKEAAQVQVREAAETADTRAYWVAELAKCQSRRETFEGIHARGFNLTEEIKRAKELEAESESLAFDDDDDDDDSDDGSKSGSESGEEPDEEETDPGDNQET
ncbi:uncharacterized protein [Nicotiana tomentosiformis]|uniref:uncharacterized protein n=1 Tax=Nicotiana tomentosiformis TaxID=4098 RepID=UPI00388CC638